MKEPMGFTPTAEQTQAVDLALTGDHIALEALAGTGKTSTLGLISIAKGGQRRGVYVAFNKAIALEAEARFPRQVTASTAHALAARGTQYQYMHRLRGERVKSMQIARQLGVMPLHLHTPMGNKRLGAGFLAGIVMRGCRMFAQTGDASPTAKHIPTPQTMRDDADLLREWRAVQQALEPSLRKAWDDITDPNGKLPFDHGYYLKIWQMNGPRIEADYLMVDEFQDMNGAMLAIVKAQMGHTQLCAVGDAYQQIYEWNGSVDALKRVDVAHRTYLTHSFRFGPEIAAVANDVLALLGSPLEVVGRGKVGRVGSIEWPDVILSRTNAVAVRRALDEIDAGGKPLIVGGAEDVVSFARGAKDLQDGRNSYHPELCCFDSWNEVREYVTQDELGGDLKILVKLIDDFSAERIISTLNRMPAPSDASVVLSTAHRGKGMEWDSVRLADDFPDGAEEEGPADEELRLLYVAVTRAKLELDIESVGLMERAAS